MEENVENKNTTKEETVKTQTVNVEHSKNDTKKKSKSRMLIVILFLLLFIAVSYVQIRGSYLEYLELGQEYTQIFYTNVKYRYAIMGINFVFLYFVIYFTNRGIKKGLKPFFEKENKKMPKLLNKSIALVISLIASVMISSAMMQKIMMVMNSTSFGIQDPIFGLDVSYYMFQKPVIEMFVFYFMILFVALTLYMALYYIIIFNRYFDGIDGKMLRQSSFMKKITRNVLFIVLGVAGLTILNIQNMVFGKILSVNDELEIVGAGMTESTVKLWGYIIFAVAIVIFAYRGVHYFKKNQTNKVLKNLSVIPAYLILLFIAMVGFDLIFVNPNELDKEKAYIAENIKNTRSAYQIAVEERNIDNSGTITEQEVQRNKNVIGNIPIITQDAVLKTLKDSQTQTGYYSYRNANLAKYKIGNQEQLVYMAPREITSNGRTYNNKTYEYTHGMGEIIASATQSTQTGNIQYVQKEVSGKDEQIQISEPRIYFGLETKETIATNTKNKQEYDYTDENGNDQTSEYTGKAGLQLGFLDRLVLGITKGDLNLAFSNEIQKDSKILINREVVGRVKKALPYLIYDDNPYTVITEEGRIVWVVDGYTVSNCYPYSQYTSIGHDGIKENINYIRNSVKVLVDAYDGTLSYYITDRTDPIAIAYEKIYDSLFKSKEEQIPEDIANHFIYPKFLYNVQSKVLKTYHNVRPDVLYRADDIWDIAKYNSVNSTKSTGTYLDPYYTMVRTDNQDEMGLVEIYTPNEKQNIISYLVGSVDGATNKLCLYKFSPDSNIVGPMQLDKQIEEDEAISTEIEALNKTGTKITKQMLIIPVENTLLYVEPIYQTMLNESEVPVPVLKKVVVASGNKLAIGDTLTKALENLLSKYAIDIEVENTDDIDGLIETIIKTNKNLIESSNNSNWEMIGKDIQKLQDLISSLEKMKQAEDEEKKLQKNQINVTDNITLNGNTSLQNQTNEID